MGLSNVILEKTQEVRSLLHGCQWLCQKVDRLVEHPGCRLLGSFAIWFGVELNGNFAKRVEKGSLSLNAACTSQM